MPVKITDITNRKHERILKHIGVSGKKYVFSWDRNLGRYAYEATKQEEVDDLLEGAKQWGMNHFSFVMPETAPTKTARKRAPRKTTKKQAVKKTNSRQGGLDLPAEGASTDEKQTVGSDLFRPSM